MIEEIQNRVHLEKLKKENEVLLIIIFYADFSEKSRKVLDALKMVKDENPKAPIFRVNASEVKDIHPIYGINTVPTILVLKEDKVSNIIMVFKISSITKHYCMIRLHLYQQEKRKESTIEWLFIPRLHVPGAGL